MKYFEVSDIEYQQSEETGVQIHTLTHEDYNHTIRCIVDQKIIPHVREKVINTLFNKSVCHLDTVKELKELCDAPAIVKEIEGYSQEIMEIRDNARNYLVGKTGKEFEREFTTFNFYNT